MGRIVNKDGSITVGILNEVKLVEPKVEVAVPKKPSQKNKEKTNKR